MFTQKDIRLLEQPYFQVLRTTNDFYELLSKNTKHCWIISKSVLSDKRPVQLYHKHTLKTTYYHKHAHTCNVEHAIQLIKGHDDYVLHPENYTYAQTEHLA